MLLMMNNDGTNHVLNLFNTAVCSTENKACTLYFVLSSLIIENEKYILIYCLLLLCPQQALYHH